jgi:hypothetical protein
VPKLACRACGRQVYTAVAIETLFTEERRCPRCGAFMERERREVDRRGYVRRANPRQDPSGERRQANRRSVRRRAADGPDWSSR